MRRPDAISCGNCGCGERLDMANELSTLTNRYPDAKVECKKWLNGMFGDADHVLINYKGRHFSCINHPIVHISHYAWEIMGPDGEIHVFRTDEETKTWLIEQLDAIKNDVFYQNQQ